MSLCIPGKQIGKKVVTATSMLIVNKETFGHRTAGVESQPSLDAYLTAAMLKVHFHKYVFVVDSK